MGIIIAKIVLMGDGSVGKTSLRRSFMGQQFTGDYQMTIGADFSLKDMFITVKGKVYNIKFQIWDLAGQARFETIRTAFYQNTVGCILVYDLTRPESFENTIKWLIELGKNVSSKSEKSPPVVLLGNKYDLKDEVDVCITKKEGQVLANTLPKYYCDGKFNIPFFETSAVSGYNVDIAFQTLGEKIIERMEHPKK